MANKLKFSNEQKSFIIDQFLKGKSATAVKRAFRLHFGQSKALAKKDKSSFQLVFDNFKKGGDVSLGLIPKVERKSKVNQVTLEAVKTHFETNNKSSVREAGREIGVSKSTVQHYAKNLLNMKPYKVN